MSEAPAPKRRWFRFSLRTLFVVMTVLCVVLGFRVSSSMRQRDAINRFKSKGGLYDPLFSVEYDYETDSHGHRTFVGKPPGPQWLQEILGVDFFASVIKVHLEGATDADVVELRNFNRLRWLELSGEFSNAGLQRLAGLHSLRQLTLGLEGSDALADGRQQFLANLTQIETLMFTLPGRLSADTIEPLTKLTELKSLSLEFDGEEGEAVLAHVSKLSGLKSLMLFISKDETAVDSGLAHLSALENLEELYLSNFEGDDPDFESTSVSPSNVGAITRLKRLTLNQWTGQTLEYLTSLANLESLTLQNCHDLPGEALVCLARLPNLRTLTLIRCSGISLEGIQQDPNLAELTIDQCETSDDDLRHLESLPKLRKLKLAGSDELTLEQFPVIPSLVELEIDRCSHVTDAGIASFALLPALVNLRLDCSYSTINDASLALVGRMANLEELSLSLMHRGITDAGIVHLKSLNRLKQFELSGRTFSNVTVDSIRQLNRALPNCHIEYDPD